MRLTQIAVSLPRYLGPCRCITYQAIMIWDVRPLLPAFSAELTHACSTPHPWRLGLRKRTLHRDIRAAEWPNYAWKSFHHLDRCARPARRKVACSREVRDTVVRCNEWRRSRLFEAPSAMYEACSSRRTTIDFEIVAPPALPKILFSHIPLYRTEGTPCGPLREARRTIFQDRGSESLALLNPFILQTFPQKTSRPSSTTQLRLSS